jgi:phospholipase C
LGSGGNGSALVPIPIGRAPGGKIQHVVIVVQENRTFDNLFGGSNGFPGANTATFGLSHSGQHIMLTKEPLNSAVGPNNSHRMWVKAYDGGKMDGFDLNTAGNRVSYTYASRAQTLPYWDMAAKYALADEMFGDNNGPTYVAHQYLIAGQSDRVVALNLPFTAMMGCDSPAGTRTTILTHDGKYAKGPFPCFTYRTIGDELANNGFEWRYYVPLGGDRIGGLNAFESIHSIFDTLLYDNSVITSERYFDDVAVSLPSVTWVTPQIFNSDHPGAEYNALGGPCWVASIVNATGSSKFWNSTVIFVTWDDWGGFYDHVRPRERGLLGPDFRVPLIVISPYSKRHYVSHKVHTHGSILHFIEERFKVQSLGTTDRTSDNLADFFDLKRKPQPFEPIGVSSCNTSRTHHVPATNVELPD